MLEVGCGFVRVHICAKIISISTWEEQILSPLKVSESCYLHGRKTCLIKSKGLLKSDALKLWLMLLTLLWWQSGPRGALGMASLWGLPRRMAIFEIFKASSPHGPNVWGKRKLNTTWLRKVLFWGLEVVQILALE